MPESPRDMLARVELMADGDPLWKNFAPGDRAALRYVLDSREKYERQLTAAIRELEACRNLIHNHADGWGGKAFEALERVEAADVVLKEAKTQARRDAS